MSLAPYLLAVFLAGCSQRVQTRIIFPDGTYRDVISFEQKPSPLNTAVVTMIEGQGKVETVVSVGTSAGAAAKDVVGTIAGTGAATGIAAAIVK